MIPRLMVDADRIGRSSRRKRKPLRTCRRHLHIVQAGRRIARRPVGNGYLRRPARKIWSAFCAGGVGRSLGRGGVGGRRCEVGLRTGRLGVDRFDRRAQARDLRAQRLDVALGGTAAQAPAAPRRPPRRRQKREAVVMSSLSLSAYAESNATQVIGTGPPRPPRPARVPNSPGRRTHGCSLGGIMAGSRSASRPPPAARSPRFLHR